jgi:hypothetical protein
MITGEVLATMIVDLMLVLQVAENAVIEYR